MAGPTNQAQEQSRAFPEGLGSGLSDVHVQTCDVCRAPLAGVVADRLPTFIQHASAAPGRGVDLDSAEARVGCCHRVCRDITIKRQMGLQSPL